jgi:hypothetical protein
VYEVELFVMHFIGIAAFYALTQLFRPFAHPSKALFLWFLEILCVALGFFPAFVSLFAMSNSPIFTSTVYYKWKLFEVLEKIAFIGFFVFSLNPPVSFIEYVVFLAPHILICVFRIFCAYIIFCYLKSLIRREDEKKGDQEFKYMLSKS